MYIQIDRSQRDTLQYHSIAWSKMGSHAQGLNGPDSDIDILYLYIDPNYGKTLYWESNGWQYKAPGVDENYQDIRHYVKNLIIGDSPADFEALIHGFELIPSLNLIIDKYDLFRLLNVLTENVRSYALIKSYLGYAKKDLTKLDTMLDTGVQDDSVSLMKTLSHIYRGHRIALFMLSADYNALDMPFTQNSTHSNLIRARALKFIPGTAGNINDFYLYESKLNVKLRADAYELLSAVSTTQKLHRRMSTFKLQLIDGLLTEFLKSVKPKRLSKKQKEEIEHVMDNSTMSQLQYKAIENGLTFQYK